jgi:sugar/nucleoside kinase (ribokinase family)
VEVKAALARGGTSLVEMPGCIRTESHANLMSSTGERVSLYLDPPQPATEASEAVALTSALEAQLVVLDLGATGALLASRDHDFDAQVWVDLHDWDGRSDFHAPFLAVADVVVASHERLGDVESFLRRCIDGGATVAIVTCGAAGSVGMDTSRIAVHCAAEPVTVVDTNGAGDAFIAGAIAASLNDLGLKQILESGSQQALRALTSRHLCASLDM